MVVAVLVCFGSITVIMVVVNVAVAMVMEARLVVVMVVIVVTEEVLHHSLKRASRTDLVGDGKVEQAQSRPKFSVSTSASDGNRWTP